MSAMKRIPAGERVDYTVTWLEMAERPGWPHPPLPGTHPAHLIHAGAPPAWYFLALYDAVGRDYAWEDMHERTPEDIEAWLGDSGVGLYTLMRDGWPAGFFVLDWRLEGVCHLAFFGLAPQTVGTGLGTYLLKTAVLTGWERAGTAKMTVNTCTLDHPRALGLYQRAGFVPVRREERSRVLRRDIPRRED